MPTFLRKIYNLLSFIFGNLGGIIGLTLGLIAGTVGACIAIFATLMGIVYGVVGGFHPTVRTIQNINLILAAVAIGFTLLLFVFMAVSLKPNGIVAKVRHLLAEVKGGT